jgi:hypothetical protein
VRAIRRTWQVGRAFLKIDTGAGEQSNAPSSIAGFPKPACQIDFKGRATGRGRGRASTRPPSSIPQCGIPSAAGGSWDRVSSRSQDRPDSGPKPCLDDRSSPPLRTLSRNCKGPGTCAAARCLSHSFRTCAGVSRVCFTTLRQLRMNFFCAYSTAEFSCAAAATSV